MNMNYYTWHYMVMLIKFINNDHPLQHSFCCSLSLFWTRTRCWVDALYSLFTFILTHYPRSFKLNLTFIYIVYRGNWSTAGSHNLLTDTELVLRSRSVWYQTMLITTVLYYFLARSERKLFLILREELHDRYYHSHSSSAFW